ncbi:HIT family protein [Robiginitomaculum antarcticum]|uniref:HIT family protein n=1 Tax=Robiginitomaculum antarcticum TaxID=437507 RepID=UPI00037EA718|nr:HIT family protein [Robiginitomaculum antarcticum]
MSLTGSYDDENVFAKILRGDMPYIKVYEDANVIAIMDVFPQSEGHILVIPRTPSRNLLETDAKDIGRLFGAVQRIAKAVDTALSPDGIVITQFNGSAAGQTVFHTHVHIIPRYDDKAQTPHASGEMADTDVLKALAAKIAAAF